MNLIRNYRNWRAYRDTVTLWVVCPTAAWMTSASTAAKSAASRARSL